MHEYLKLLAQATPNVDVTSWLQWGVLGLVILAIVVFKQLVPGWIYEEQQVEIKQLKTDNKDLTERLLNVSETALPALKESTAAVAEAMREIRRLRGESP